MPNPPLQPMPLRGTIWFMCGGLNGWAQRVSRGAAKIDRYMDGCHFATVLSDNHSMKPTPRAVRAAPVTLGPTAARQRLQFLCTWGRAACLTPIRRLVP